MRKKLEENEVKQQSRHQHDVELVAEEELVKPMTTPSPPKTPVTPLSPIYSNFLNHSAINFDISSMNRLRKTSNSSDTSFDSTSQSISTTSMTSMATSPSPAFSDDTTWNKLLGHTHWHPYKLFDSCTNLFN